MGDAVGTVRKVSIDGIPYDVYNDADITFNESDYAIEGMATTGRTLMKRTKRVKNAESIVLAVSPAESETLLGQANSLADKTFSVELADGSVKKATGQLNYENYTSADGKANVQFITRNGWTTFTA